jgi:hypothetical protein
LNANVGCERFGGQTFPTNIIMAQFQATLVNKQGNVITVTYRWNDGQNGYKNTTIQPNDNWVIDNAQDGDTFSWAIGANVPPNDAPYIAVKAGENPIPPE